MQPLERIPEMEAVYQEAEAAVAAYEAALVALRKKMTVLQTMSDYYGSEDWFLDLDYEEREGLPEGMTSGVLSEDGVYNILTDIFRLGIESIELGTQLVQI